MILLKWRSRVLPKELPWRNPVRATKYYFLILQKSPITLLTQLTSGYRVLLYICILKLVLIFKNLYEEI